MLGQDTVRTEVSIKNGTAPLSMSPTIKQDLANDEVESNFGPLFDRIAKLGQAELSEAQVITELEKLGLLPAPDETPIWQQLTPADWLQLLRGIARYSPHMAFSLVEARAAREQHVSQIPHPWKDFHASEIGLITSGCLWHAWQATLQHAQTRPMFRRHLADFPAIRLRLLKVFLHILRADSWASLLATSQDFRTRRRAATTLRFVADQVRIETQLLCGGTGYMRESPYAKALNGLQKADTLLRTWPSAKSRIFVPLQIKIDVAVRAKLMQLEPEASQLLSALLVSVDAGKTRHFYHPC